MGRTAWENGWKFRYAGHKFLDQKDSVGQEDSARRQAEIKKQKLLGIGKHLPQIYYQFRKFHWKIY